MKFTLQGTSNYLFADTAVENIFLSEYMTKADGDHIKVYLYALMCAENGLECDNNILAQQLDLDVQTVEAAWEYWEKKALIRRLHTTPGKNDRYDIEFVRAREALFGSTPRPAAPKKTLLGSKELSELYANVEAVTGRLLANSEIEGIAGLVAEYGMDPDTIVFGFKYCTDCGKSNRFRYVAAVLKDWRAKDLTSVRDIEEYLAGIDRHYESYRRIFRELGFNRSPSEPEKRIMDSWLDDYAIPMDRILEACAKTTGISSPNLNYVNAVLVSENTKTDASSAGKEDIFAKVEAMYVEARERNERLYRERRAEIFTQIPRLREITDELRDAAYKISRNLLGGSGRREIVARERERVDRLNREKAELLADAGYSFDAADMSYDCPDCRDTGFTDDNQRCHCYGEKLAKLQKANE